MARWRFTLGRSQRPDSLHAVLDDIEQRGGAVAVLRELGISEAELAVMRERAIAIE